MNSNDPLGYDTLKLRAVFIPDGNPNNVTTADITNHLGHGALRIRAVFIPDGNPNNVSPADITNWLGHDVVKVRYVWNGLEESQPEQEPPADGPDGGERAARPIHGAAGPGFTPIGQPAASAMPPTPTLAQAARYVDPARTAAAAWRAIVALSPPSQPTVPRGADGQGGTVARPDTGSGDAPGSSKLDGYAQNDLLNLTDPTGLTTYGLGGVTAELQAKGGSGSIAQASENEIEPNAEPPQNLQRQDRQSTQSPAGPGVAPGSTVPGTGALQVGPAVAGSRPPSFTPEGASRSGAFNAAKQMNGIPTNQQPSAVLPNVDRSGNPQPGNMYIFDIPAPGGGTRQVIIRDDASGHYYGPGDTQNRGPHFNDPSGRHFDY